MVELLVAGHCVQLERLVRRRGTWRPIKFPSLVALLPHPGGGVVLFDTGYAPRFRDATARLPFALYAALLPVTCASSDAVVQQLAGRGIDADDVRLIVLSHLHGDHVAGVRDFPRARIVLGEHALPREWRTRSAWHHARHGFVPQLLPPDFERRILPLHTVPVRPTGLAGRLRNGHDLLGDGSALVIALPGHVAGHQGLWLPGSGPDGVLLAGDAVWNRRAFTAAELPMRPLRGDRERYQGVVAELARLHAQRPDVLIVPSHCTESIAAARQVLDG